MIRVRRFAPGDAEAVARALVDSSMQHAGFVPDRYEVLDPERVADDYRHDRQNVAERPAGERRTLVAELDGEVVGVVDVRVVLPAGAHRPIRYGYVAELAVEAVARRRGVGAELLAGAEQWAREQGCAFAVLDYNARTRRRAVLLRPNGLPAGRIVIKNL